MAGFVKLDSKVITSSLWSDRDARDVFITALCMALPYEVEQPLETFEIGEIRATGFDVPPGWYGFVAAAGPGLVRAACVEREPGIEALKRLSSPDPDSRDPDYEGRRLVRVDGGFIVLNFDKYRERDYTAAERAKRYRTRKRDASRVTPVTSRDETANVTQAEDRSRRQKTEAEDSLVPIAEKTKHVNAPIDPDRSVDRAAHKCAGNWEPRNCSPGKFRQLLEQCRALDGKSHHGWWFKVLQRVDDRDAYDVLEAALAEASNYQAPAKGVAAALKAAGVELPSPPKARPWQEPDKPAAPRKVPPPEPPKRGGKALPVANVIEGMFGKTS